MPRGKVKWFDVQKGFGFIVADEGGPDVFVHQSVSQDNGITSLDEGQVVEFESEKSAKGLNATTIQVLPS